MSIVPAGMSAVRTTTANGLSPELETSRSFRVGSACDCQHDAYGPMARALRELPCCIGWHLCGAYLRNRCRNCGFRDERNELTQPLVGEATASNHETRRWVSKVTSGGEA